MSSRDELEQSIDRYRWLDSPIGPLLLAGNVAEFIHLGFSTGPLARDPDRRWLRDDDAFAAVADELHRYFVGDLTRFSVPPSRFGTAFQRAVWTALQSIPFGTTASYGEIARAIGKPGASRAVGAANHVNPLPVIVPCHRVVGSNGKLVGFGGGLEVKRALLEFERRPISGAGQTDLFDRR